MRVLAANVPWKIGWFRTTQRCWRNFWPSHSLCPHLGLMLLLSINDMKWHEWIPMAPLQGPGLQLGKSLVSFLSSRVNINKHVRFFGGLVFKCYLSPFWTTNNDLRFLCFLISSIQFGSQTLYPTLLQNHQNGLISLISDWVPFLSSTSSFHFFLLMNWSWKIPQIPKPQNIQKLIKSNLKSSRQGRPPHKSVQKWLIKEVVWGMLMYIRVFLLFGLSFSF